MKINFKNIYITKSNELILILFNISNYHYIGIPLYNNNNTNNYIKINYSNFYYAPKEVRDFKYNEINKILYLKGKPVTINNKDFINVISEIKNYLIFAIHENIKPNTIENLLYIKWINEMFKINNNYLRTVNINNIRLKGIYWVDFGFGIGSELRKLRPAILWRYTKNKEICTFIPLTSKHFNDKYNFHYDLSCINKSSAKIESLQNLSYKRIYDSYMIKGKPLYINKIDFDNISKIIIDFYTFQ